MIRDVNEKDAARIAEIYNYYVTETLITFEEEVISANEVQARIKSIVDRGLPWIVWESEREGSLGILQGYAYAGSWRTRAAFRYTIETAVYLAHDQFGQGIGYGLYESLLTELRKKNIHAVIGMVALPNPGSVRLHEKLGFQKVGHFPRVGNKFNQWIDVGAWQLMLDWPLRSSKLA